jgi:hypothetical protein
MKQMSYQKLTKSKTHFGTLQIWQEASFKKKLSDEESDEDSMVMTADKDLGKNEYQKLL